MGPNNLGGPAATDNAHTKNVLDCNPNLYDEYNPPTKGQMWPRVWRKHD